MNFQSDASTLPSVRQARRLPAGTTLPSRAGEPGAAEEGPGLHTPRGGSGSAALSWPRQPARGPMNQRSVSAGAAPSRRRGQGGRQRRAGLRNSARCAAGARGRRPLRARRRRAARGVRGPGQPRRGSAGAAAASPGCGRRSLSRSLLRWLAGPPLRCSLSTARGGESERGGEGARGGGISLYCNFSRLPAICCTPRSSPGSGILSGAGGDGDTFSSSRHRWQTRRRSGALAKIAGLPSGSHLRHRGPSSPGSGSFPGHRG